MVAATMKLKDLAPWKESYDQPRHDIKKRRHHCTNKGLSSQSWGFSSGHEWMWELEHREDLIAKEVMISNCGVGEDSWESLDSKEIKPVNPKGNQPWILIGRTDAEAEAPILWPPDMKGWPFGKDPDAGKDWEQEENGAAEDKMAGWHHQLNRHDLEQNSGK